VYSKSENNAPVVVEVFDDVGLSEKEESVFEEKGSDEDAEDKKSDNEYTLDDDYDDCKECKDVEPGEPGEDMEGDVGEGPVGLKSVDESEGKNELLVGMFVVLLVYSCVIIGNCVCDSVIIMCMRRNF
jgi:hypothetical protein